MALIGEVTGSGGLTVSGSAYISGALFFAQHTSSTLTVADSPDNTGAKTPGGLIYVKDSSLYFVDNANTETALGGVASDNTWTGTNTFSGEITASTGLLFADDKKLYFGTGKDASFEYDEDGTDTLLYAGASLRISDDVNLEFGTGGDWSIEYDEDGDDDLKMTGTTLTVTTDTATFTSANQDDPLVVIKNTTNHANGPRLRFVKDKGAAGAANDVAGMIEFYADDANQDQVLFGRIASQVSVHTDGQEGGLLAFQVASHDGEINNGLVITDGSAEDEIDVTIGNGSASRTTISGDMAITTIANPGSDVDKFLVSNSGVVGFRTGAEVASDIGAVATSANSTFTGVITFASDLTASHGLTIPDDTLLRFGNASGGDATIEYDENGTDELRFAGAAVTFEQAVSFDGSVTLGADANDVTTVTGELTASLGMQIPDDKKLYFGNGYDWSIEYDEDGDDDLKMAGTTFTMNAETVTFTAETSTDPLVIIKNFTNDANGARLRFVKDRGSAGAANDVAGIIEFYADDANQDQVKFSEIKSQVKVHTNGQEGGKLTISVAEHDGTSTAGLVIEDGDADGELDVTIGAGADSLTTIAGDLDIPNGGFALGSDADGDIYYRNSNNLQRLAKGSDGEVLTLASGIPSWAAGGSASSLAADNLTNGDAAVNIVTTSGNITLDAQANDADVIIKVDDNGSSVTAVTFDGSDEGNAIFVNDLRLSSDAAAIHWGANNEITLSHEHDVGLVLTHLASGDDKPVKLTLKSEEDVITSGEVIGAIDFKGGDSDGTDAVLVCAGIEAVATDTHAANNNAAKLSFKTGASETAAEKMALTSGGDLQIVTDGASIFFGADSEIELRHVADDGLILKHVGTGDGKEPSLTFQAGDNDIAADDVLGSIFFQAPDEGAGTDAVLVAAGIEAVSEGNFAADNNATKLSFLTAASAAAAETMSLSSAGNLTVSGTITCATSLTIGSAAMVEADLEKLDGITNGTAAASKAVVLDGSKNIATIGTLGCGAITSTGNSSMAQLTTSGRVIVDDTTAATSTTDGSLQTDGGLSVALDAVVGDDLILLSDSSVIHFGTNSEITLTHEHNVGLILEGNGVTDCPVFTLKNTNNDATGGTLKFLKDGANVADNDVIGNITFVSEDDGDNAHTFASIVATIPDMTDGAEEGKLTLNVASHDAEIQPGLIIASGDTEDEVDVTIGNGGASVTTTAGSLSVTSNAFIGGYVHYDSSPADTVAAGLTATFTAGEDLEVGECAYFKSDGKMWKAVATAAATANCVAMATADISADATGVFLLKGFLRADTNFPTWTVGGRLFTPEAETSGHNVPEQTAPDTDGDFVQVIGWAVDGNTIYFCPDSTIIEVA